MKWTPSLNSVWDWIICSPHPTPLSRDVLESKSIGFGITLDVEADRKGGNQARSWIRRKKAVVTAKGYAQVFCHRPLEGCCQVILNSCWHFLVTLSSWWHFLVGSDGSPISHPISFRFNLSLDPSHTRVSLSENVLHSVSQHAFVVSAVCLARSGPRNVADHIAEVFGFYAAWGQWLLELIQLIWTVEIGQWRKQWFVSI